jgi:hypothetical protein
MTSSLKSKFDKSPCRVLFLSADKLTIFHWEKGKLGNSYLFDAGIDGQKYFNRYLQESPNVPVYILVDLLEEEYHQDTIPHVYGADRKTIIDRKKSRLFRDTPYFHTDIQGRQEEGRRDDLVLFMGLTNPGILKPWLALLEEHKVPLAGIYSLPQITNGILDLLPDPADQMLVVSLQSISGLRQTFFHKNKLKISRLVNIPRYGTVSYATEVRDEVETIQRYLNGLHLTPEDKPLDVYLLANKELLKEIELLGVNVTLIKYHFIDIELLFQNIGLDTDVTTPFSDQLFAHQLLKHKPKNLYAVPSETRYFQMRNMRRMMLAASLFMILGSVVWGGLNFMGGMLYKQQGNAAMKKTDFYSARYQIARERLPHTAVTPANLELVVNIVQTLEKYKATPFDMLKLLSTVVDKYPMIEIDEIEWAASTDPNLTFESSKKPETDQAVLGVNIVNTEESYQYYQIAAMKGHLSEFDGNYRVALNTINKFNELINSLPSVHDASIMSLPLDIGSDANLQGAANSGPGKANFSVRIVMGIQNES